MNPNSAHQTWSKWTVRVILPYHGHHIWPNHFESLKYLIAKYFREEFGSVAQAKITHSVAGNPTSLLSTYTCECRSEGKPTHDPDFQRHTKAKLKAWFKAKFGPQAVVNVSWRFEAGDRQDGTPLDQLIILPGINL